MYIYRIHALHAMTLLVKEVVFSTTHCVLLTSRGISKNT